MACAAMCQSTNRRSLTLGSPTCDTELFPAMAHLVRLIRNKRMSGREQTAATQTGQIGDARP